MTPADELRRLFPAPRRRPGVLTILVRWRVEIAAAAAVATAWWYAGGEIVLSVTAALAVLVVCMPPLRTRLVDLLLIIVVPHRVRSGLIQAGVTDRAGRPPWGVWTTGHGDTGFVTD